MGPSKDRHTIRVLVTLSALFAAGCTPDPGGGGQETQANAESGTDASGETSEADTEADPETGAGTETGGESDAETETGDADTETETGDADTDTDTETESETGESETGDEEPGGPAVEPPEGPPPPVSAVSIGSYHACVLLEDGGISCWGSNTFGQLGLGHTQFIGRDEYVCGRVDIGGAAIELSVSGYHSCALREDGELFCWGSNRWGQLGRGDLRYVGNDESPLDAGPIDLGEPVERVWTGFRRTCARVESGALYCWGENEGVTQWESYGVIGYGDPTLGSIGDDESPLDPGPIEVGGIPIDMVLGQTMCAALDSGELRCWGLDRPAVGADHGQVIGDDETPLALAPLALDGDVIAIAGQTRALLDGGQLRAWGSNGSGQLGLGHFDAVGHEIGILEVAPIELGEPVVAISRSCAIVESGALYCWGGVGSHRLGYPNIDANIGGDLLPLEAGPVELPGPASAVDQGATIACARVESELYCWGSWAYLGVVAEQDIGDDEPPASLGPMHFGYESCEGLDAGPSVLDGSIDAELRFHFVDPGTPLPTDYVIGATLHIAGNNDMPQCEECERKSFSVRNDEGELLALKIEDYSLGLQPGVLAALELDAAQWSAPIGIEQLEPGLCAQTPSCAGTTQRLAVEFTHPDGPPARLLDGTQGLVSGGYMASVRNLEDPSPDSCDALWNHKLISLVRRDCAPDCGPSAWVDSCEPAQDHLDRLSLHFNSEDGEPSEYAYELTCEILDITDEWRVQLDCAGIP